MRIDVGRIGWGMRAAGAAFVVLVMISTASNATPTTVFESNFDSLAEFIADWNIIDAALDPTQGVGVTDLTVIRDTPNWGRTDTNTLLLGSMLIEEMKFSITMGAIQADWTLVNIAYFEENSLSPSGFDFIGVDQLFGNDTVPLMADGTVMRTGVGLDVPEGTDGYRIQIFVGGTDGSAEADQVLVTIPEPSTAMLVGLGVIGLGAMRRRRD